jgi:hypothetical protein
VSLDLPPGWKVYRLAQTLDEERFMELTLLTIPGCPGAATFAERLTAVLADRPGAIVCHRVIAGEAEAAQAGMHGSPTLLIDGVDPFAAPRTRPSLSCRLYWDPAGPAAAAPSVQALRLILAHASDD